MKTLQVPEDADGFIDSYKIIGREATLGGARVRITDTLVAASEFVRADFISGEHTGKFVWLAAKHVGGERQLSYEPGVYSDGYLLNYTGVRTAADDEDDMGGEWLDDWDGEIAWD